MPHPHSDQVIEAWRRLRPAGAVAPGRTALSPLRLGPLLPQTFVVEELADGAWRLRVAGGLLEAWWGRPLAGTPFAALWAPRDRPALGRLLASATTLCAPRVVAARGSTGAGRTVALEMTLVPIAGLSGRIDRRLGLLQPLTPLARLAGAPLTTLHLASSPHQEVVRPRLIVDNTRAAP